LSRLFATRCPAIPDELKKKAGFSAKPGTSVYLRDFTEAIPDLIPYYEGSLIGDQLVELREFYEDKAIAKDTLHSDVKRFHDEIVLIYRARNKILHGGKYEDAMLEFYTASVRKFCQVLMREFMNQYKPLKNISHTEILAALYSQFDVLIARLEVSVPKDILFEVRGG
jgi:hypothetical protein